MPPTSRRENRAKFRPIRRAIESLGRSVATPLPTRELYDLASSIALALVYARAMQTRGLRAGIFAELAQKDNDCLDAWAKILEIFRILSEASPAFASFADRRVAPFGEILSDLPASSALALIGALLRAPKNNVAESASPERLGEIYEDLLGFEALGQPFRLVPGSARRDTGSHYTPRDLVRCMVVLALEPLVYHGPDENLPRFAWQIRSPSEILALRICDPAMGAGAFLIGVCRYLAAKLVEADHLPACHKTYGARLGEARRLVAENCLYGVDSNPFAVDLARLALGIAARSPGLVGQNLRMGNSLVGCVRPGQSCDPAPSEHLRPFHWNMEFPEILANGGFDAVIGNPPWRFLSGRGSPAAQLRRQGQIGEAENMDREIAHLSRIYGDLSRGCKDYCKWFAGRSRDLARPGGSVCLLLPASFLNLPRYRDLRQCWLAFADGDFIELGFGRFSAIVPCAIACGKNKNNGQVSRARHSRAASHSPAAILAAHFANPARPVGKDGAISPFRNTWAGAIYARARYSLGDLLEIREGSHEAIPKKPDKTDRPGTIGPSGIDDMIEAPLVLDATMAPFRPPKIGMGLIRSAGLRELGNFHSGERFLIRKTGDKIVCAPIDTPKFAIARQNVHVCKARNDLDTKALCAILSSSLMTRLYQAGPYGQKGRALAQIRLFALRALPMPDIAIIKRHAARFIALYNCESLEEIDRLLRQCFEESGLEL